MLTLGTTNTIGGVAGTNAVITYTIVGMTINGLTESYSVLAQGQLGTGASNIYTVPGSTTALIKTIILVNASGSSVPGVILYVNGLTATYQITGSITMPADSTFIFDQDGYRLIDNTGAVVSVSTAAIHGIADITKHSSAATAGNMLKADANGLPVNATNIDADVSDAVTKRHARAHSITSTGDHSSAATSGYMLKADVAGLPAQATNTDTEVADAVTKKHPQVHNLGGADHNTDTLANLNLKISDADVVAFAGQIGGTAASPDIRGIRETVGPTLLTFAGITDGEYLKRSATSIISGVPVDTSAIHKATAAEISAMTEKTVLVGADVFVIEDSAASYAKKKVQVTNLPVGVDTTAIHKATAGEFAAMTLKSLPVSSDLFVLEDSAAANAKKYMTIGTIPSVPRMINVVDYGAVGNARTVFDGACAVGAPTKITSATMAFVAGDNGKRITLSGAGVSGAMYAGVITAIDSATQVTVSPNISTTVSTKGLTIGTDDTTAIQNAFNAAANATYGGAMVYFPVTTTNRFLITATLTASKTLYIKGQGGAHTTDIGDYTKAGGTWLVWNAATQGTTEATSSVISIQPVAGASNTAVVAPRIEDINIDCRNGDQSQAVIGLQLYSAHGFTIRNVFIMDAAAIGIEMHTIQGSLGEAKDCSRGQIDRLCIRELDANQATLGSTTTSGAGTFSTTPFSLAITSGANFIAAGWVWVESNLGFPVLVNYTGGGGTTTLTGCTVDAQDISNAPTWVAGCNVVQCSPANGCCIELDGTSTANACENHMIMAQLSHGTIWGPAAMEFKNSDSWLCTKVVINGGSNVSAGAINRITKPGVRFNGSNTSSTLSARNNVFIGSSAGAGGCSSMGVNNAGTLLTSVAIPNFWELYELGNGEPIPTSEAGAFFYWSSNGGLRAGSNAGAVSVADQAVTAATSTLLTGSLISVPPQGFQVGTVIRWIFNGTKTAAGTAARTFYIRCGATGTTADAAIATFTSPAGTGVVDTAYFTIVFTVRGPLGASCAGVATLMLNHNLSATGFATVPCQVVSGTMATWNSATAQQFLSVTFTSGASEVVTFQQMHSMCLSAGNP